MPTTYPQDVTGGNLTHADFDVNQNAVVTRIQGLLDLDLINFQRPIAWEFNEVTHNNSTPTKLATFYQYIPDYSETFKLNVSIDAKVDAGTGTFYIEDDTTSTAGTSIDVTQTGYTAASAQNGPSILTIATGWTGRRAISIWGSIVTGALFSIKSNNRNTVRFTD